MADSSMSPQHREPHLRMSTYETRHPRSLVRGWGDIFGIAFSVISIKRRAWGGNRTVSICQILATIFMVFMHCEWRWHMLNSPKPQKPFWRASTAEEGSTLPFSILTFCRVQLLWWSLWRPRVRICTPGVVHVWPTDCMYPADLAILPDRPEYPPRGRSLGDHNHHFLSLLQPWKPPGTGYPYPVYRVSPVFLQKKNEDWGVYRLFVRWID